MPRLGLRAVLVALVLAAVLPGLLAVGWSTWHERERELRAAETDLHATAQLASAHVERLVEGAQRTLAVVAAAPAVRALYAPRCSLLLQRLLQDGSYVSGGMANAEGGAECNPPEGDAPPTIADRAHFQRALATGSFAIGEYMISRSTGLAVLGFGMPVRDDGGHLVGVAYVSVGLERVGALLRQLVLPVEARVQLVSAEGTVLASNQAQLPAIGSPLSAELMKALRARPSGVLTLPAADGTRTMHLVRPVAADRPDTLTVLVSAREDAVLADWNRRVRQQLLAVFAAALLGVGLAWWLGRLLLHRPMAGLLDRVRRLERAPAETLPGTTAVEAPRTREIAELDAAMAELTSRLRQREQERDTLLAETRAQSSQLEKVQRLARIAGWEVSLPGGEVEASPALQRLVGGPLPATRDERLALVHPADRATLRREVAQVMAGAAALDVEFRLLAPDGGVTWLRALGELELGPDREPRRLVGALQDVGERRRAELALREHQARQAAAMSAARLGSFDEDMRTGTVVWLGHHEEMWGYAPGEFDGSARMFTQRIHPEDLPLVEREVAASLRLGLPFRCEYRVLWPDGSVHWIVDSGSVVRDAAGEPVRKVGVVMDVTAQKVAQLRVEEMGRRISVLLESTSDGFVAIDRGWRVTDVNRHGARVLGYEPTQMLGRTLLELFPAGAGSDFERLCLRAMRERTEQHGEAYFARWDRWFENHLYPSDEGVSVFFRDVTERRREAERLDEMVARLKALREMDRALLQLDSTDAVVRLGLARLLERIDCTRTAYMRFDLAADLMRVVSTEGRGEPVFTTGVDLPVDASVRALLGLIDRDGVASLGDVLEQPRPLSPLLQRLADHGVRSLLALTLQSQASRLGVLVLWSTRPHHFDRERVSLAGDIADRLNIAFTQAALRERIAASASELEQRVAERTAEVEAANTELEAFSYSVSHDLRAPLQSIAGFTHVLLARHRAQLDEKGRHYLERIAAGARQMDTLIAGLLSLARVSHAALEPTRVDLAALARETIARLREAEPGRQVDVLLPASLPVWGDRLSLGVLLDNLLGNAWKFTAPVGQPRIELAQERDEHGEEVIVVRDNGVGFDMQYVDKLFQAFRRLHSAQEFPGTGIGLATVRRIVLRHGGRVWARSTPGVSTELRFTLPHRRGEGAATA
jgi:PAS domain S-box-containing protein